MDELLKKLNQWWRGASPKKRGTALVALIGIICTGLFLVFTSVYQPASTAISTPATDKLDNPLYYFGVVAKTVAVLLLIVGGAVVLRRYQQKQPGGRSERSLAVVETTRLSPKQALHLVRAGNRHYLIGATDQSINLLSEVQISLAGSVQEENLPLNQPAFEAILAKASGLAGGEPEAAILHEQEIGGAG